ncbi:MAG: STM4015 family protein [Betaproteobacteria bacterium]
MTISDATTSFFGKPVKEYDGAGTTPGTASRLSLDYDAKGTMPELIEQFLARADKSTLDALVIGAWGEPQDGGPQASLAALIAHAGELPAFKALFVGDMTYEECEISWIVQGDYGPLLAAFPRLELLRIRGGNGLVLPVCTHAGLRELVIESGGLPSSVFESLMQSTLPALGKLELWVGTSEYGFDGDVALVNAAINELRTPTLRHLGLRDAEIADEIAQWIAGEAWVAQLDTLDLSLGTLGDVGATALLASPHVRGLKRLDLSHHYISAPLQARLKAAIPGVVLDDPQEDDEDRYVAVGE